MKRLLAPSLVFALCAAAASASASCRDAKDGEVVTISKDFATADAGVYTFTPPKTGAPAYLPMGTSAKSDGFRFCAYLELPPPGGKSAVGVYFWKNDEGFYIFFVLNDGQYLVTHKVFEQARDLVPGRTSSDVRQGPPRIREIDIQANHWGASVKLDGRPLTDFVARPPSGDTSYGLVLEPIDKPVAFRFAAPIRFGK